MTTTTTSFRFRLFTAESVGAYTEVQARTQTEALAQLRLPRWQSAVLLHGPNTAAGSLY